MSALMVRPEEEVTAGEGAAMVHSKALEPGRMGVSLEKRWRMMVRRGKRRVEWLMLGDSEMNFEVETHQAQ